MRPMIHKDALPRHRREHLRHIQNDLQKDPDVWGLFLGSSLAENREDAFSDIDLRIIVHPDAHANYITHKYDRPHHWGQVWYHEDADPAHPLCITHFETFIKVDAFYFRPEDLQPTVWLKSIRILYDPRGIVQQLQERSLLLRYQPNTGEVEQWRGKVLARYHEIYRRIRRRELLCIPLFGRPPPPLGTGVGHDSGTTAQTWRLVPSGRGTCPPETGSNRLLTTDDG